MKILHFIYDDINNPWYGGGASLRTHEIYKRLSGRHDITVVTGSYPEAKKDCIIDGVRYFRLGSGNSAAKSVLTYSLGVFSLKKKEKYDLVVKDLIPYAPTFTPFIRNVPSIASIQMAEYPFFKSGGLLGVFPFLVEQLGFRLYSNYVVPSMGMKEIVLKKTGRSVRIAVIPYGVHDHLFEAAEAKEEKHILYLGRFDIYHKGLDILLAAFKKVLVSRPDLKLVLAGGGRETENLKKMVKELSFGDRIEFAGRVSGLKKKGLIEKSLFVVMPSRFESWGIVALEAGACGKAVIGTDIKCLSEAIKNNETGILVPSENSGALAEAILALAADRERRRMLGEAGRNWAKKFNWDNIALEQERFYEEVVNAG